MKWFNEILTAVKVVFGLEHDATEQEVHEKLTSMKSYDDLKAQITADVRAVVEQEEGERYGAQIAAEAARADAAEAKATEIETKLAAANTQIEQLQADIKRLETEATALKARIVELEKLPGATHTNGDPDTGEKPESKNKPYLNNPVYLRAQKMRRG